MAARTDNVGSALQQLADALLDDLERIAKRSVSRMQERLPAYAEVPAEALLPVTLANTRNLLEAVLDPGADPGRAEDHFRMSGETRSRQGVTADALLQAWRIGVESVREEAHAVAGRLGISDEVLLQFVEATLQWGDIGMRVSAQAHREAEVRELERLAEEQAGLRRVATLVARESSPEEVFAQVAEEVGLLVEADTVGLCRYERDELATLVAAWGRLGRTLSVGSRFGLDDDNVTALVYRTRRPARFDAYDDATGPVAEYASEVGLRSACGTPIFVGGRMWGAIVVASSQREAMIADAESRMEGFTELVATAISNIEARSEVQELAEEQAALRRVATLVAEGAEPQLVFDAVCEEAGRLVFATTVNLARFTPDGFTVTVSGWSLRGVHVPRATRLPLDGAINAIVWRTAAPGRCDSYEGARGELAALLRQLGIRSEVGAPVVVDGQVWGALIAGTDEPEPLAVGTERRLARFAELIATAIANAESRTEVERLADEQAALRRVATLVAQGVQPAELFSAVTQELARLFLDVEPSLVPSIIRFDPGPVFVLVGSAEPQLDLPIGSRWGLKDLYVSTRVFRTGRSARVDEADLASQPGSDAELLCRQGFLYQVGSPIGVEGQLWGAMTMNSSSALPPDTGERLESFTELIATAIANAESRDALRQLAEEQGALRRVATLVAQGASPSAGLDAVAGEMQRVLDADAVTIGRYESGDEMTVVAHRSPEPSLLTIGTRTNHEGKNVTAMVRRTEQPARLEDLGQAHGGFAELFRSLGMRAVVGTPIVVDGRLWGTILASWNREEAPPAETEERMAQFAALLDTAIANADSRDQLTASRARLVTEADEARRRVVRDLHDGAQQRLVHTIVTLKLAQRALKANDDKAEPLIAEGLGHAERGNAELRELAHGLLPAVLTQGGLRAGVNTIVSRVDLPVEVDIPAERLPAETEASAYFVVAEALTNVMKHSHAERAEVRACVEDGMLQVEVRDDGVGGADPNGHGLVGLGDRLTALGGQLKVESPEGGGTLLAAQLPASVG